MRLALLALVPLLAAGTPIELAIHVAVDADGAAIADAEWIEEQVSTAAAHLGGADVELTWRDAADPSADPDIVTVSDRNALATRAADDGAVHVFVVPRLADKDVEGAWLNGVHWRYGGDDGDLRGRRYVILSREARWPTVLAHELGHFFGLSHTDNPDGLMTTAGKRTGEPSLDARQLRTIKARAKKWARRSRR